MVQNHLENKINKILKLANNSVTDPDIIRQIGMFSINPDISDDIVKKLIAKVKQGYEYAALYPM